jgi:hypothetical protein
MPRPLIRIAFLAAFLVAASVAVARMGGPPKGVTGAPAIGARPAEPNCQRCHDPSNPLNDASGLLEILDVPATYTLDTDYVIRVRLSHTWAVVPETPLQWGFEMTTARADSGVGYGTFVPGTGTQNVTAIAPGVGDPTRRYISHDISGIHKGDVGPVEWTFTWHSPNYSAPKVYFFAAGNSANGDSLSSNDFIFTAIDSTTFEVADVPLAAHGRTWLATPYPNPGSSRIALSWTLPRSAHVTLDVTDVAGRAVRDLVDGVRSEGQGTVVWDGRTSAGSRAPAGVYFARLRVAGEGAPLVQRLSLTH